MSFSWWWVGAGVIAVAALSGAHWAVIDMVLDVLGSRSAERWRDRRAPEGY